MKRHKILKVMRLVGFASLSLIGAQSYARAADISFLCAIAMQSAMQELLPEFQKASGHTVKVSYANIGVITQRLQNGDEADLAIVGPPQWNSLQKDGKVSGDTRDVIGKVGIGISVRKGAVRPDIGSVEAFKRALLNASSIAIGDPNQGSPAGVYTIALLDRLGIGGEIKSKLQLVPPGSGNVVAEAVVRGAEIGIDQMTLIMSSPDVDLVGPLPADIQNFTTFRAALPTSARQPAAANALIAFLASPQAVSVFRSKGFDAAESPSR